MGKVREYSVPNELKVLSTQDVNQLVETICCMMMIRNVLTENVSSAVRRRCLCRTMILDKSGRNGLHDEWSVLIKKKVLKTKLPQFL